MRKIFALNILVLIACVLIDQLTKTYIGGLTGIHQNYGLFLGSFTEAPAAFRVITLVTFSGFLFFIYFVSLYLIPNKVKFFKYALSMLQGGIFGNVIDRLTLGFTRDFIPSNFLGVKSYFNVADIFLFVGSITVLIVIFKFDHLLWKSDNSRTTYLVNPREQLRLAFKFFMVANLTSLLIGLFAFSFLKVYLTAPTHIINDFIIVFSLLSIVFSLSIFMVGILISHRSAGPLYAFEKYVGDLINGEDRKLKLREGDNYKHLEKIANKLHTHFYKK